VRRTGATRAQGGVVCTGGSCRYFYSDLARRPPRDHALAHCQSLARAYPDVSGGPPIPIPFRTEPFITGAGSAPWHRPRPRARWKAGGGKKNPPSKRSGRGQARGAVDGACFSSAPGGQAQFRCVDEAAGPYSKGLREILGLRGQHDSSADTPSRPMADAPAGRATSGAHVPKFQGRDDSGTVCRAGATVRQPKVLLATGDNSQEAVCATSRIPVVCGTRCDARSAARSVSPSTYRSRFRTTVRTVTPTRRLCNHRIKVPTQAITKPVSMIQARVGSRNERSHLPEAFT